MNTPSGKPRKVIPIATDGEVVSLYEAQKNLSPASISGFLPGGAGPWWF